jgi:hypothetical protein
MDYSFLQLLQRAGSALECMNPDNLPWTWCDRSWWPWPACVMPQALVLRLAYHGHLSPFGLAAIGATHQR